MKEREAAAENDTAVAPEAKTDLGDTELARVPCRWPLSGSVDSFEFYYVVAFEKWYDAMLGEKTKTKHFFIL